MICPHCNKESDESVAFCTNCGYPMPDDSVKSQKSDNEQVGGAKATGASSDAPNGVYDTTPSGRNTDYNYSEETQYNNIYGDGFQTDFSSNSPKKKKSKAPIIIFASLVLVIAIVGGYLLSAYNAPLAKMARALENVYEAGNFSADFEMTLELIGRKYKSDDAYSYDPYVDYYYEEYNYTVIAEGTAEASWDLENREISFYAEVEMTEKGSSENVIFIVSLYDGKVGLCEAYTDDDGESDTYYDYEDISDELDEIFDAMEDNKDKKFDDFFTEDFIDDMLGDDAYDEITEEIDLEALKKCIKNFFKLLNDKSWLKENAGMETERVDGVYFYNFKPDLTDLVKEVAPVFEDAFKDDDLYKDMKDELLDEARYAEKELEDLTFSIGLSDGYITHGKFSFKNDDGRKMKAEATLFDIGKTTFDSSRSEDFIKLARERD